MYPFLLQKDGRNHCVKVAIGPLKAVVRPDGNKVAVINGRGLAKAGYEGRQVTLPEGSVLKVIQKGRTVAVHFGGQPLTFDKVQRTARAFASVTLIMGVFSMIAYAAGGFRWIVVPGFIAGLAATLSGAWVMKEFSARAVRAAGVGCFLMGLGALPFRFQTGMDWTTGRSGSPSASSCLGILLFVGIGIFLTVQARKLDQREAALRN
jgi:hypothetical protein